MHQSAVRLSCIHRRLSRDTHFLAKCASTRSVWLSKFGFDGRSRDVPITLPHARSASESPRFNFDFDDRTGRPIKPLCSDGNATVPAHYFDQNSQGPVSGRVL